ncbi:hypothetical protein D8M05_10050 [Oceanobacillus bengalensis]|uniref:Uncharacterized protein n=1 Tax=Oceanobacillus bengalensis TaxID=1435466 RepID=A0A494YZJ5_9BACI|nr:hypothetical protein D8M05_10050 [Oceanobacillus bengalensis]
MPAESVLPAAEINTHLPRSLHQLRIKFTIEKCNDFLENRRLITTMNRIKEEETCTFLLFLMF